MTISADTWQARAALCELLALSFRYPEDDTLADAVASGEWDEAAEEIAGVLGLSWNPGAAPGAAEAASLDDAAELKKELRTEATRLFVGAPSPAVNPYEGAWRAEDDGVAALYFVNPHSMAVERFCSACGLGRPEGTNEPLDAVWVELDLLEYLALRAAEDNAEADGNAGDTMPLEEGLDGGNASDGSRNAGESGEPGETGASSALPGGSPEAAWDAFFAEHAAVWMPRFAEKVQAESHIPFYRQAASLLEALFA